MVFGRGREKQTLTLYEHSYSSPAVEPRKRTNNRWLDYWWAFQTNKTTTASHYIVPIIIPIIITPIIIIPIQFIIIIIGCFIFVFISRHRRGRSGRQTWQNIKNVVVWWLLTFSSVLLFSWFYPIELLLLFGYSGWTGIKFIGCFIVGQTVGFQAVFWI